MPTCRAPKATPEAATSLDPSASHSQRRWPKSVLAKLPRVSSHGGDRQSHVYLVLVQVTSRLERYSRRKEVNSREAFMATDQRGGRTISRTTVCSLCIAQFEAHPPAALPKQKEGNNACMYLPSPLPGPTPNNLVLHPRTCEILPAKVHSRTHHLLTVSHQSLGAIADLDPHCVTSIVHT